MQRILFFVFAFLPLALIAEAPPNSGLALFYWNEDPYVNFGDYIAKVMVERIVQRPVRCYVKKKKTLEKKLFAIGSTLYFAADNDIIWGAGINGKTLEKKHYEFSKLDVRAVRGPLTREFLRVHFQIEAPEVYGDPALLFPYLFPEFKRKENPKNDYIVIPHFLERKWFPKTDPHVVYPTDPWDEVVEKILDSRFVISSSLHGIVLAEAYGIPARLLRLPENNSPAHHIFKFQDYYCGTSRPHFQYATSVEEALRMGGEVPFQCDLEKLYEAFPFEYWPDLEFKPLILNR